MTGLLFHGPEVFDSGWGRRIIEAMREVDVVRCVLAGTMGRTAVIDQGLDDIEFPGKMPAACLRELAVEGDAIVLVNFAKSEKSGLTFGAMVIERAEVKVPVVQLECSGPFWVEWIEGCDGRLIEVLRGMVGVSQRPRIRISPSIWEAEGKIYRRMTTVDPGDFILVDGIMVGRATKAEIVLVCENGHIAQIHGAQIKTHGIEKLDRFGGIDPHTVKLASASMIRRTGHTPRTRKTQGHGVVFVDHAGMYIYDLADGVEGVVTVGDDTTAVVGDILYRFQIPVIGIVDGDADMILQNGHFTKGSVELTVPEDDIFGLKVFEAVFQNRPRIDLSFMEVRDRIVKLANKNVMKVRHL